jgi:hypothetical protein
VVTLNHWSLILRHEQYDFIRLRNENGIKGLELVSPNEPQRAAEIFHRDGFVAVRDALDTSLLERLTRAANTAILQLMEDDRDCSAGGGGDIAMPGAIEYQGLNSDNMWSELPDPVGTVTMRDVPVPVLTINFPLIDLTYENGPIWQMLGSQWSRSPMPNLAKEPDWMKLSNVCPAPAGTAIFRDIRAWHGGTPSLSRDLRAMPNIEYYAP